MPADKLTNGNARNKSAALLEAARATLQAARAALNRKIGSYPSPIPACDAQFNGLLDQRRRLSQAIRDIDAALHDGASETITADDLRKIADTLVEFDDTLAARLKSMHTR
jgi:hypothetical protein